MRRPSHRSQDPEERRLAALMTSYISRGHSEFIKWLDENCPSIANTSSSNKKLVLLFVESKTRKPSGHSKDLEEKRLNGLMRNYISPSSPSYDPEFREQINARCSSTRDPLGNINLILNFVELNNRKPLRSSKDPNEKRLFIVMSNYIRPSSHSYRPGLREKLEFLCPSISKRNPKSVV